jgi:hypothetical protein
MTKTVVMGCHLSRRLPLVFVALDAALVSPPVLPTRESVPSSCMLKTEKSPPFHSQVLLIVEREQQKLLQKSQISSYLIPAFTEFKTVFKYGISTRVERKLCYACNLKNNVERHLP